MMADGFEGEVAPVTGAGGGIGGAAAIGVDAVGPGVVRTAMTIRFDANPQIRAAIARMAPRGRFARPEEIASAVVWRCADGASVVAGHPLVVNGGVAAR